MGCDPLTTTGIPQPVRSRRLDGDAVERHAEAAGNTITNCFHVGREPGLLRHHHRVYVDDPVTGCVVDYGYLKRVVNRLIIERFDHHHLNYAAEELAWRSSTEMLCVYIWEQLIEYLPGLSGIRLYETTNSWCDYQGRSLAEQQVQGSESLLYPFRAKSDYTELRRRLIQQPGKPRMTACSVS